MSDSKLVIDEKRFKSIWKAIEKHYDWLYPEGYEQFKELFIDGVIREVSYTNILERFEMNDFNGRFFVEKEVKEK